MKDLVATIKKFGDQKEYHCIIEKLCGVKITGSYVIKDSEVIGRINGSVYTPSTGISEKELNRLIVVLSSINHKIESFTTNTPEGIIQGELKKKADIEAKINILKQK